MMFATSTEFDADRRTAEQNNECDDLHFIKNGDER